MASSAVFAILFLLASAVAGLRLQDHRQLTHHKFYLGRHRSLHGYAFVHYHTDHQYHTAAQNHTRRLEKRQLSDQCTSPIAPGARWRSSEGYYVHTSNTEHLSEDFILATTSRAMDAWKCVLGPLGITTIGPRLGVRRNIPPSQFVLDRPTGENEIGFGPIEGRPGTIAVTVVWGIFGGPETLRQIREFKMRFDETHYNFGNASLSAAFMDLESIATHESGHANGLDDIYLSQCAQVTMFGTSRNGETKKRTLAASDASGLLALYR